MGGHLLRRLSAMEADLRELRSAAIALRDDLLMRAEIDDDGTKVVNASNGRWQRFCAAIEKAAP